MIRIERAVRLDDALRTDPRNVLERVDVLRVVPVQRALELEQLDEVVARRRLERARVQFLSQREERFGVLVEVVQLEDGARMRQVVLLQVVVQPRFGGAKVRDAGSWKNNWINKIYLYEIVNHCKGGCIS